MLPPRLAKEQDFIHALYLASIAPVVRMKGWCEGFGIAFDGIRLGVTPRLAEKRGPIRKTNGNYLP